MRKIVILNDSSTSTIYPPEDLGNGMIRDGSDYPMRGDREVVAAIEQADVVLAHFAPHAPLIIKGDVEVVEYHDQMGEYDPDTGWSHRIIAMVGSTDRDAVAAENEKLRSAS